MMSMDPVSAGGFAAAAGHYARARPVYARAVVGAIAQEVRRSRVLDLGAGTGILTGQLGRAGCDVVGLEPLGGMVEQFRRALPRVPVVRSVAETVPFVAGSFEGVTIAQAFHWMDHGVVLREVRRVLRPDGVLAVLWNVRDESVPWVAELADLVEARTGGRPYSESRERPWTAVVGEQGGFRHVRALSEANPVRASQESVLERVRSTSFVAVLDPAGRDALLQEVRELLRSSEQTSGRQWFDYPHHTRVDIWRRE